MGVFFFQNLVNRIYKLAHWFRRGMKIGNLRRDGRSEKSTYIKSVGRCLLINQQLELNNKLCLCHRKKRKIYTHISSTYTEICDNIHFSGIDSMYE